MKIRELQLKLAAMRKTGLVDGIEEKVKLESVGCCDGGYIPDGDEDKDYLVLDGFADGS